MPDTAALKALLEGAGYEPLPFPDPDIGPGAVVQVTPVEDGEQIEYVGSVLSCGVPAELVTNDDDGALSITSTTTEAYGAGAALKAEGVSAGSNFDALDHVVLRINNSGPKRIDLLALDIWLSDPNHRLPDACQDWLNRDNIGMIRDAFVVGSGEFEAFNLSGARLSLSNDDEYFNVSGSAKIHGKGNT